MLPVNCSGTVTATRCQAEVIKPKKSHRLKNQFWWIYSLIQNIVRFSRPTGLDSPFFRTFGRIVKSTKTALKAINLYFQTVTMPGIVFVIDAPDMRLV
jgi:hypothetical protein